MVERKCSTWTNVENVVWKHINMFISILSSLIRKAPACNLCDPNIWSLSHPPVNATLKHPGNTILDPIFHHRLAAKLINLVWNGQLARTVPTAEHINKDHDDSTYPDEQIGHICTLTVNQSYVGDGLPASSQYGAVSDACCGGRADIQQERVTFAWYTHDSITKEYVDELTSYAQLL